ncbi:hypothetical protein GCM10020220_019790 [Nonomuraea rubra]
MIQTPPDRPPYRSRAARRNPCGSALTSTTRTRDARITQQNEQNPSAAGCRGYRAENKAVSSTCGGMVAVTFSTIVAAVFVIAFVIIIVSMLTSLTRGRPATRRASRYSGMPFSGGSGSGWGGGDSGSGWGGGCDSGGSSGGDGGGGGGGG